MSFLLCVLAVAVAGAQAHPQSSPGSHATHAPLSSQAPADEYFGPLHMSAIGIRMRIDVLGRRYHARTEQDADLVHDAGDVEAALKVWNRRYPNDVWAAPTAYHLAQLYAEMQTPASRSEEREVFAYVASTFPRSSYAHRARTRLAQGFPPLHSESPVVATPGPSGSAASQPTAAASAVPSGASPATSAASSAPNAKPT